MTLGNERKLILHSVDKKCKSISHILSSFSYRNNFPLKLNIKKSDSKARINYREENISWRICHQNSRKKVNVSRPNTDWQIYRRKLDV